MAKSESIIEVKVILEETEAVRQLGKLLRDMGELIDSLPEWGCESKQIARQLDRRARRLVRTIQAQETYSQFVTDDVEIPRG